MQRNHADQTLCVLDTDNYALLTPPLSNSVIDRAAILGTAISQGVYFYLYSLLREAAVARKHVLAGTVAAAGQASRTEELPVSANLVVASLAGMGNVLATNPIWRAHIFLSSLFVGNILPMPTKAGAVSVVMHIKSVRHPLCRWLLADAMRATTAGSA